ncbi:MAG: stage II sporulation protein M [Deltaproteobacteria bacterium]|nr:stage II sporulation protein M [Deltaproteobacteria bacterium]
MVDAMRESLLDYTKRLRPYFVWSVLLFGLGALAGVLLVNLHAGLAGQLEKSLMGFAGMFRGLSKLQLAGAIFLNNSVKSAMAIFLGTLLGILPVVFLLVNGAALGAIVSVSLGSRGIWQSTMAILPHGVIELPAVFLATSIGLLLGSHLFKRLLRRQPKPLRQELAHASRFLFWVIVPLLLIAALIEAYLTPVLAKL